MWEPWCFAPRWLALRHVQAIRNERMDLTGLALHRHSLLALMVATVSITVLSHSFDGAGSLSTGLFMTASTLAVCLASRWHLPIPSTIDFFFICFLGCIGVAFSTNGAPMTKDTPLLILSLSAYPACRLMRIEGLRPSFAFVIGGIVAIGTALTAIALFTQWDMPHGKVFVFGYDHAATAFLTTFGFLLIALTTAATLDRKRALIIAGVVFLPVAIFAASMIRFTFVAIACSLAVAAFASDKKQRTNIVIIMAVCMLAICCGLAARYKMTANYFDYLGEVFVSAAQAGNITSEDEGYDPCINGSIYDSIAIREALIRDSVKALPNAGFFGTGLDSFERLTCVPNASPHNSFLQAFVEFGWLGGASLLLVVVLALKKQWPMVHKPETKFVTCCLILVVALDMAHGDLSRDALLFMFLGYAAAAFENDSYGRLDSLVAD